MGDSDGHGSTFVLVHGAWGGSYGWREVRRRLWAAGHETHTPSLTGIGDRAHLAWSGIDLSTHVRDVVDTVLYEDLRRVVLVGFSYGGMVAAGALRHLGGRVHHLVMLDALVPDPGDSAASLLGLDLDDHITLGDGWAVPPRPRPMEDAELQAWSEARRSPQPVRTLTEPVRMERPLEDEPIGLTYVKATADPDEPADSAFRRAAGRARSSDRWAYHEIDTHHLVPLSRPDELTAILLGVAADAGLRP